MMIFVNDAYKEEYLYRETFEPFLLLLAPYAPHLAEELWEQLGNQPTISRASWPEWREELTKDEEVTVVVQINGKVRSKMLMPADTGQDVMEEEAMKLDRIRELIDGKEIKKVITVANKLVNIVAK